MRHIYKKINLSQFKSYMRSLVPACKDGMIIDVRAKENQAFFNISSNYGMLPLSCLFSLSFLDKENGERKPYYVNKNGEEISIELSWHSIHEFYKFVKSVDSVEQLTDFSTDELNEVLKIIGFDNNIDLFAQYFSDIKNAIVYYAENGEFTYETERVLIEFNFVDDITPGNECKEPSSSVTSIELPLFVSNKIDNLGQMDSIVSEWQAKIGNKPCDVVFYDEKDWIFTNPLEDSTASTETEDYKSGYTWNKTFKENVFGNLHFNTEEGMYEYMADNTQWERNIEYTANSQGDELIAYKGEFPLQDKNILYSYKGDNFIPNPTALSMADKYQFETIKSDFFVMDGIIHEVKEYDVIEDFNCVKGLSVIQFEYGLPYIQYGIDKVFGHAITNNGITNYVFIYKGNKWNSVKKYGALYNGEIIQPQGNSIFLHKYREYEIVKAQTKGIQYLDYNGDIYIVYENDDKTYSLMHYELSWHEEDGDDNTIPYFAVKPSNVFGGFIDPSASVDNQCDIEGFFIEDLDLFVFKPYNEYSLNYVSGTTLSQLTLFKTGNMLYDDFNNGIRALLLPSIELTYDDDVLAMLAADAEKTDEYNRIESVRNKYRGQLIPKPNDSLSLLYAPGTIRDLTEVKIDDNGNTIYWGNILDSIEFFTIDSNGYRFSCEDILNADGHKPQLIRYVNIGDSDNPTLASITYDKYIPSKYNTSGEVLKRIFEDCVLDYGGDLKDVIVRERYLEGNENRENIDNNTFEELLSFFGVTLYCKIKYNIGAFIKFDNITKEYSLMEDKHHGIEYWEDYRIERREFIYHRSLSESYKIYYYELLGSTQTENTTDDESEALTNFTFEIPIRYKETGSTENCEFTKAVLFDNKGHFKNTEDSFDEYNNFMTLPLFRRDFNIGTSAQEIVKGDIYINRGISSAFEKHLKLHEVSTLQDLENYSNGGFFSIYDVNG